MLKLERSTASATHGTSTAFAASTRSFFAEYYFITDFKTAQYLSIDAIIDTDFDRLLNYCTVGLKYANTGHGCTRIVIRLIITFRCNGRFWFRTFRASRFFGFSRFAGRL